MMQRNFFLKLEIRTKELTHLQSPSPSILDYSTSDLTGEGSSSLRFLLTPSVGTLGVIIIIQYDAI